MVSTDTIGITWALGRGAVTYPLNCITFCLSCVVLMVVITVTTPGLLGCLLAAGRVRTKEHANEHVSQTDFS